MPSLVTYCDSHSGKIRAMSVAHVILCTCPDEETAASLSRGLVERKLVACVNILPGIRSIYRWQGTLSDDSETLMVIKSLESRFGEIEANVGKDH